MNKKFVTTRTGRSAWLLMAAALAAVKSLQPATAFGQITFLNTWGSLGSGDGQFNNPEGVAVSGNGTVYAMDTANSRVEVFNSSGGFQSSFGSFGGGNGEFFGAEGVAV